MFYVLAGTLTLHRGDREIEAGLGTFACVPPGVVHTFRNDSDRPARLLNFNTPAGWENHMRDLPRGGRVRPPCSRSHRSRRVTSRLRAHAIAALRYRPGDNAGELRAASRTVARDELGVFGTSACCLLFGDLTRREPTHALCTRGSSLRLRLVRGNGRSSVESRPEAGSDENVARARSRSLVSPRGGGECLH